MMITAVLIENLAGGMGTAAFIGFLMSLCDKRYTATQFALLSALSAVGRVFAGPLAGYMVEQMGWPDFFFWTVIWALPGLVILVGLKGTISQINLPFRQKLAELAD